MAYIPQLAFQPYVDPYVGQPIKEVGELGEQLNKQFEKNISEYDELDILANTLNVSEGDAGLKQAALDNLRGNLAGIKKNKNWEDANPLVRESVRQFRGNNTLLSAVNNKKKIDQLKQIEAEMSIKGETPIKFADYDKFSTVDPATGAIREFNATGAIEKMGDYYGTMSKIFEGIQADGYDREGSSPQLNSANGMVYQVGSGSSARYITAGKIRDVAARNLGNYLQTNEGRQRLKVLTTQNSQNPTPLSAEAAQGVIFNELVNTGMKRTFSQTASKNNMSLVGGASQLGLTPPPGEMSPNLEQTPITQNNPNPVLASIADKLTPKERGSFQGTVNTQTMPSLGMAQSSSPANLTYRKPTGKTREKLQGEEAEVAKKIGIAMGIKSNGNNYSTADLARIAQYAKERSNVGISSAIRAFQGKELDDAKKYLKGGAYIGREWYSIDEKKMLTWKNLPQPVKDVILKADSKEIQVTGVYDTDNMFYDVAKDNKSEKLNGWISPEAINIAGQRYAVSSNLSDRNKDDIEKRTLENRVSYSNRYGEPMYLSDGNLITPLKDGLYMLLDKNGKPTHKTPWTKEQVADYAFDQKLKVEEK